MENRLQLIAMLLTEEEQANSAYISGEYDRDKWTDTLRSVDDKLSVLGVRLSFRPWESGPISSPKF